MPRRLFARIFVTLATFLVVWIATSAASAAEKAPVCDPRGAIAFAPPPQIQDLEQSIDVVTNDDDCTASPLSVRNVTPDRAPAFDGFGAQDSALPALLSLVTSFEGERLVWPDPARSPRRPGFTSSIERPPRL
jgi:hypothetical protein